MSEPTYRIDLEHQPQWTIEPWQYIVWALGEEKILHTGWGKTSEQATTRAIDAIRSQDWKQEAASLYATETGELVERQL